MKCNQCKCNRCGKVNDCFILAERFEIIDKTQAECSPILSCSEYSAYKERSRYRTWECMIQKDQERSKE